MPTSSFLKVNYRIPCYQERTRSLFLIYSSSRLELTLSTASCFVRHRWNIDVTAKNTFFSPLFYLYWNHKLSYIYISFIEVFYFYGFALNNNTCTSDLFEYFTFKTNAHKPLCFCWAHIHLLVYTITAPYWTLEILRTDFHLRPLKRFIFIFPVSPHHCLVVNFTIHVQGIEVWLVATLIPPAVPLKKRISVRILW